MYAFHSVVAVIQGSLCQEVDEKPHVVNVGRFFIRGQLNVALLCSGSFVLHVRGQWMAPGVVAERFVS